VTQNVVSFLLPKSQTSLSMKIIKITHRVMSLKNLLGQSDSDFVDSQESTELQRLITEINPGLSLCWAWQTAARESSASSSPINSINMSGFESRETMKPVSSMVGLWRKDGDFMNIMKSGGFDDFTRYTNQNQNAVIRKLKFHMLLNGIQISVKASSSENYEDLVQAMLRAGFDGPDKIDQMLQIFEIESNDLDKLKIFLETARSIEPDLSDIEAEVYDMLNLKLGCKMPCAKMK
jgi:hypothetical protein